MLDEALEAKRWLDEQETRRRNTIAELREEIVRLRAALAVIADDQNWCSEPWTVAREALKPQAKESSAL